MRGGTRLWERESGGRAVQRRVDDVDIICIDYVAACKEVLKHSVRPSVIDRSLCDKPDQILRYLLFLLSTVLCKRTFNLKTCF